MARRYRKKANFPNVLSVSVLASLYWGIFLISWSWAGDPCPGSSTPAPAPDSPKHTVPDRPPDAKNAPRDIGSGPFDGIPKDSGNEDKSTEDVLGEIKRAGYLGRINLPGDPHLETQDAQGFPAESDEKSTPYKFDKFD